MGKIRKFFSGLIRAQPIQNQRVNVATVSTPSLLTMRSNLYDVPEIRTAIQKTANHFARVKFFHLKYSREDGDHEKIRDSFHYCLNLRANKTQSAFDFKEKLATLFYMGQDVFIKPTWSTESYRPKLDSIEIIDYYGYEVGINVNNKEIVIKFYQADGSAKMYYFSDLAFIQRFPQGLNPSNSENNKKSIADWIEVATGIKNAILKTSSKAGDISLVIMTEQNLKDTAYQGKIEEINKQVEQSKNGVIFIGGATSKEVMSVNPNNTHPEVGLVDDVLNNIYNFYDSNKEIVKGKATDIEFEQYVDSAIKPLAEKVEQELTHLLFSRESIDKGNEIKSHMVDITVATLSAKTAYYKEMAYSGIYLIDEARDELGKRPMPNGLGKVPLTNKNTQPIEIMLKGGDKDDSQKTNDGDPDNSQTGGGTGEKDD